MAALLTAKLSRKFAAPRAIEDKEPYCTRQIPGAPGVDRRQQRIDGYTARRSHLTQSLPEPRLERNARRVPGDPHRAFEDSGIAHRLAATRNASLLKFSSTALQQSQDDLNARRRSAKIGAKIRETSPATRIPRQQSQSSLPDASNNVIDPQDGFRRAPAPGQNRSGSAAQDLWSR
jgi:hypothetical protein